MNDMCQFKVKEIPITDINFPGGEEIGIMKVQMPEQEEGGGSFRIKNNERKNNIEIVKSVLREFTSMKFSANRQPSFLVFPELSVSIESAQFMIDSLPTDRLNVSSVIIFGVEEITLTEFRRFLNLANNKKDFTANDFGKNIQRVNTAIILVKKANGTCHIYCQPKLSQTRYEKANQFKSNRVYIFDFNGYRTIISICSDFLLTRGRQLIMTSVLQAVDKHFRYPSREKIHLWFHIQKNPHPMIDLYKNMIKILHYKVGHKIDTTKTIVCTLNSANIVETKYFRNSHVSVMDRGRPPDEFIGGVADCTYGWKQFSLDPTERDILRWVQWRLRHPGLITFLLNVDEAPYRGTGDENSIPIREPNILRLNGYNFETLQECAEVYELKEIVLQTPESELSKEFKHSSHKKMFGNQRSYLSVVDKVFCNEPPTQLVAVLACVHDDPRCMTNCDHWHKHHEPIKYFLVSLRLLQTAFDDLKANMGALTCDVKKFILIVDCEWKEESYVQEKAEAIRTHCRNVTHLLFQRIQLYDWDGRSLRFDEFTDNVQVTKSRTRKKRRDSISISKSPYIISYQHLVNSLNACMVDDPHPEEKTKEIIRASFQD